MNPPMIFKSALLLAARNSLATVDKQALRACGVRDFQILSSGAEAARLLAAGRAGTPEMVLCSEKLADMSADDFVRLLRLHPALVPYPVIVAVTSDSREVRERARECGYSGLLARPYTHAAIHSQMDLARRCRDATAEALKARTANDTSAFETALSKFEADNNPEDQVTDQLFRQGLLAVRQQHWDEAIGLLQEVLRRDGTHVESMIALATSWQGKGDIPRSVSLMGEAIAIFADRRQWERTLAVALRLLRDAPNAPNPLLAEVGRLLAGGQHHETAPVLELALRLPLSEAAVDGLVRACAAAHSPAKAREHLLAQLKKNGANLLITMFTERAEIAKLAEIAEAAAIQHDNTQFSNCACPLPIESVDKTQNTPTPQKQKKSRNQPEPKNITEPGHSAFERSFPKLHEALMVAKVTLSLFRSMK